MFLGAIERALLRGIKRTRGMKKREKIPYSIGIMIGTLFFLFLSFGFTFLMSLFINWGIGFISGYSIGVWKVFVGIIILNFISKMIFPARTNNG